MLPNTKEIFNCGDIKFVFFTHKKNVQRNIPEIVFIAIHCLNWLTGNVHICFDISQPLLTTVCTFVFKMRHVNTSIKSCNSNLFDHY